MCGCCAIAVRIPPARGRRLRPVHQVEPRRPIPSLFDVSPAASASPGPGRGPAARPASTDALPNRCRTSSTAASSGRSDPPGAANGSSSCAAPSPVDIGHRETDQGQAAFGDQRGRGGHQLAGGGEHRVGRRGGARPGCASGWRGRSRRTAAAAPPVRPVRPAARIRRVMRSTRLTTTASISAADIVLPAPAQRALRADRAAPHARSPRGGGRCCGTARTAAGPSPAPTIDAQRPSR